MLKKTILLITTLLSVLSFAGCTPKEGNADHLIGTPSDYSDVNNWAYLPEDTVHEVDTFFIYPTVYSSAAPGAPKIVPIDNQTMRNGVINNYEHCAAVFDEYTNVYEPFYRQTNLAAAAEMNQEEFLSFLHREQLTDIYAALDYYFEHYNQGRPFILAGHSQGSALLKIALTDYFRKHDDYLERMVAAYVIGFSFTEDDLSLNPALKFAASADDTGVVVSWNTEGPANQSEDNIVVMKNALSINPISWKRDGTKAEASENLGTRLFVRNEKGNAAWKEVTPGLLDAQVDPERGVVVCTTVTDSYSSLTPLGPASLHSLDYLGYWGNIKANIKERIDSYMKQNK